MAGDWIKMRGNLWDDPRVARICDMTDSGEAAVVGALYWLWSTADQHTEDGCMPGLTLRQIDRKTGLQGFGAALVAIGWLVDDPQGVVIQGFEEHNGTSAKRRATDAQRKATFRNVSASDADNLRTDAGQKAPDCGAREREEIKDTHTALASDWVLPKAWGDWAIAEYPHWTPDVIRSIADQFADHFRAKASTSADWLASWNKWCRDDLTHRAHPQPRAAPVKAPSITVPSTDKGADQFKAAMDARAASATKPPPGFLTSARRVVGAS